MTRRGLIRILAITLAALSAASNSLANCGEGQVEIYPTAQQVPANLLRMYVYFPRPMRATKGLAHVRLVDGSGTPVDGAFLATRDDLWSPDRRRLTLILDPGRVKTGLEAHERLGRALVPGQSYVLEVSGAALDADGCALGADRAYAFSVGPADVDPPDPESWDLAEPAVNTVGPLVVTLGGAHDHLSLAYRLRVLDVDGAIVPGTIALGAAEDSWVFTPTSAWVGSTYSLAIDPRLEDLAGNRPGAPFDRPAGQAPQPWLDSVPFSPRP